jgi:hypothetical protein
MERSSGVRRPERDSSKSKKWNIYKNAITMVYGGNNKISTAKNIASVLQLQDRDLMWKVLNTKLVPDALQITGYSVASPGAQYSTS